MVGITGITPLSPLALKISQNPRNITFLDHFLLPVDDVK
jgi:hypothetical protein